MKGKGVCQTNLTVIRNAFISLGKTSKEICAEYKICASTFSKILNKPARVSWQTAAKLKKIFGNNAVSPIKEE